MTKWFANVEEIVNIISEEVCAPTVRIITHNGSPSQVHRAMGLQWDPSTDCLSLYTKNHPPLVQTRRGMLSQLHSFFYPIGFTSPFLLKGKLMYKECSTLFPGVGWDDTLPSPKTLGRWKYFMNQLEGIRTLTIVW